MSALEKTILSPKEYQKMIRELDIENVELKTSSLFEAKTTLVQLLRLEENLHEIRNSVSGDIRSIKLKHLNSGYANKSSLFGLRRTKISTKRMSMNTKCDREAGPYKHILDIIDDYLEQIENAKNYINNLDNIIL
jgi:hypothetical protein